MTLVIFIADLICWAFDAQICDWLSVCLSTCIPVCICVSGALSFGDRSRRLCVKCHQYSQRSSIRQLPSVNVIHVNVIVRPLWRRSAASPVFFHLFHDSDRPNLRLDVLSYENGYCMIAHLMSKVIYSYSLPVGIYLNSMPSSFTNITDMSAEGERKEDWAPIL